MFRSLIDKIYPGARIVDLVTKRVYYKTSGEQVNIRFERNLDYYMTGYAISFPFIWKGMYNQTQYKRMNRADKLSPPNKLFVSTWAIFWTTFFTPIKTIFYPFVAVKKIQKIYEGKTENCRRGGWLSPE